jgi:hypothetical protein
LSFVTSIGKSNNFIKKAKETQDFKIFLKKRLTLPLGEAFIIITKIKNKTRRYLMIINNLFMKSFCGGLCAKRKAQGAKRIIRLTPCSKRHALCAFPLAAGGSRLLHPIHGRGVFQRSNIISDLIGSMRRMVARIISDLKMKPVLWYI